MGIFGRTASSVGVTVLTRRSDDPPQLSGARARLYSFEASQIQLEVISYGSKEHRLLRLHFGRRYTCESQVVVRQLRMQALSYRVLLAASFLVFRMNVFDFLSFNMV